MRKNRAQTSSIESLFVNHTNWHRRSSYSFSIQVVSTIFECEKNLSIVLELVFGTHSLCAQNIKCFRTQQKTGETSIEIICHLCMQAICYKKWRRKKQNKLIRNLLHNFYRLLHMPKMLIINRVCLNSKSYILHDRLIVQFTAPWNATHIRKLVDESERKKIFYEQQNIRVCYRYGVAGDL